MVLLYGFISKPLYKPTIVSEHMINLLLSALPRRGIGEQRESWKRNDGNFYDSKWRCENVVYPLVI